MKRIIRVMLWLALFAGSAAPALAHANLVRSEPPAGAALPAAPERVRLWFSEEIEPAFSSAHVLDSSGAQIDKRDSAVIPDDRKGMQVSLPPLPNGFYTVVWETLSAVDGHAASGSFAFAVGESAPVESSPRAVMALVEAAVAAAEPPALYPVAARWFNLLALILLAGTLWFPALVLRPALRGALPDDLNRAGAHRWRASAWVTLALAAFATATSALMQAQAAGGIDTLGLILRGTRFGLLLWVRALLVVVLAVVLLQMRRPTFTAYIQRGRVLSALAFALLVVQALNSHAAAVDDPPLAALLADVAHLAGAAVWVGGLAQLALVVPAMLGAPGKRARPVWTPIIARFSNLALLTVAVISLSGIYASVVQVGSLDALLGTTYGNALLVKLVFMTLMLAAAAFNRRVARGRLAEADAAQAVRLLRGFRVATLAEVAAGVCVLLAVGVMTSIAPGRSAYDPAPKVQIQTQTVDDLIVTLGAAPGMVGANDFDVFVRDSAGRPVAGASAVRILATQLDMAMGTQEAVAQAQSGGHYTLHSDLLSMRGNWRLEVLVRRDGRDDARPAFDWRARAAGAGTTAASPYLLAAQDPQVWLGFILAVIGVVAGAGIVQNRQMPHRSRLLGAGAVLAVVVLGGASVLLAPSMSAARNPVAGNLFVPPGARDARSPLPATADTVAAGKQAFQINCVVCHGLQGKGNGPLAVSLNPRPADLTIHVPLHSDGELFYWVSNGIAGTAMPNWAAQLDETTRWQIIAYLRVLAPAP